MRITPPPVTATRRIVKFRVINPKSGKLVGYERLMLTKDGGVWQFSLDDKEWEAGIFEGDDWHRDQASGMYNQDKREFYENDIVARGMKTNLVVFSQGRFGMKDHRGHSFAYPDRRSMVFGLDTKLRIVGNVHQNPELLKSGEGTA
jgi:hypothetical protein